MGVCLGWLATASQRLCFSYIFLFHLCPVPRQIALHSPVAEGEIFFPYWCHPLGSQFNVGRVSFRIPCLAGSNPCLLPPWPLRLRIWSTQVGGIGWCPQSKHDLGSLGFAFPLDLTWQLPLSCQFVNALNVCFFNGVTSIFQCFQWKVDLSNLNKSEAA